MLILTDNSKYNNSKMYYYEVLPNKIVRADKHLFTYEYDTRLSIGAIVSFPIGKKNMTGVIVKNVNKPIFDTKPITNIVTSSSLSQELIKIIFWISGYYNTHPSIVLNSILPKGLDRNRRTSETKPSKIEQHNRTHFLLNTDQKAVLKGLSKQKSGSAIIQGVTGSGKTAVYIELAKKAISEGRSVLILLPEIALTSQIISNFSQHFDNIQTFHSHKTEAEKHITWSEIATSKKPSLVIGARSALFLPFKNLGLIVVDESHEPSYKQDKSPKYSALRVAGMLGKLHGSLVVFGSATPSISERYLAESGNYPIYKLGNKAKQEFQDASVKLVDMRNKSNHKKHTYLSDELLKSISDSLKSEKQSLVYHNRRGSRSTTLCESCGWSALCPKCFIPMTLHADTNKLKCRICLTNLMVPNSCPECKEPDIIHKGIGTKQIEADLKKLFPEANIARFDGDNIKSDTLSKRYDEIYSGDIDIVIGTQIIAKGLDLPKLETVGVIQAESGLALPDYTSSERTFQLLAQVAGRVGRHENESRLVVQTYQPDNESVVYGTRQDYENFYQKEIEKRRRANFPPFCHMAVLTCVYKTESSAITNSNKIIRVLKSHANKLDVEILGPTPAFYERLGGTFRWQILLKSKSRSSILELVDLVPTKNWLVDIDPSSLL